MVGIVSYGVYIPRLRLRNREIADVWGEGVRSGERAVPDHDEDPITMAVEATDNALKRWGGKAESLEALYLATDTGPYRGKPNSTILASELGVRPEAVVADVQGGSKAGTTPSSPV